MNKEQQKAQRDKLIELAQKWVDDEKELSQCNAESPGYYNERHESWRSNCWQDAQAASKAFRNYVEHMHDEPEQCDDINGDKTDSLCGYPVYATPDQDVIFAKTCTLANGHGGECEANE